MGELTISTRQVYVVEEQGVIPRGRVCHGVFTTQEEAALLPGGAGPAARPGRHRLAVGGPPAVETVEEAPEPKMLRAGRDYEDKMRQERVLK